MPTTVQYGGRKFAGDPADDLEAFVARLAAHPLARMFERAGGFCEDRGGGRWSFFGNFQTISAAFRIDSDEPEVVERLRAAIAANMLRPDYLAQPAPFRADLVRIERKRFSTTQGEVELFYDGRRITQYGDDITLQDGEWRGHPDNFWVKVAERWFHDQRAA